MFGCRYSIALALITSLAIVTSCFVLKSKAAVLGMYSEVANSTTSNNFTTLSAPSINSSGDIAFRAKNGAGTGGQGYALRYSKSGVPKVPGTYTRFTMPLSPGDIAASTFMSINDSGSVGMTVIRSGILDLSAGDVRRYDYATSGYFTSIDVREESTMHFPPPEMYTLQSLFGSVNNNGTLTFYNRIAPNFGSQGQGIFTAQASQSVTSLVTTGDPPKATSIIQNFASSNAGAVIYATFPGGGVPAGTGIYSVTPGATVSPTATGALGFSNVGNRAGINDAGAIAFYAEVGSTKSVFVSDPSLPAGQLVNTNSLGVQPQSIPSSSEISINSLDQVAYLGIDKLGRTAIFSTNLGATREIIAARNGAAAGDQLTPGDASSEVTGLSFFQGLNANGQIAFSATTNNSTLGAQIVVASRGFTQVPLQSQSSNLLGNVVPWQTTPYLNNNNGQSTKPPTRDHNGNIRTIGSDGCNMVSVTNILSYFGAQTSPADFQQWLITMYNSPAKGQTSGHYITAGNDISSYIVKDYSQYLYNNNLSPRTVVYRGSAPAGSDNFGTIVTQLRAGNPVELQAPNGAGQHFIVAYGFADPTQTDFSTKDPADILVMDPGHSNITTLADYDQLISDFGWLNTINSSHLRLFQGYDPQSPNAPAKPLIFNMHSPAEMVIVDPLGHRLGLDPDTGAINQIAGGQYSNLDPYTALDSTDVVGDPNPIKELTLPDPIPGQYHLQIIGTASGQYEVTADGLFEGMDSSLLSGLITSGQRIDVTFNIPLLGDFNRDGIVDAADYTVWRDTLGSTTNLAADGNGSGIVDQNDLDVWKAHFGNRAGGGAGANGAVPEPTTKIYLILGSTIFITIARRKMNGSNSVG